MERRILFLLMGIHDEEVELDIAQDELDGKYIVGDCD